MRKWVITSVLESEKTYLGILDILMQVTGTFLFSYWTSILIYDISCNRDK